jgi:hypothetical protein
MAELAANVQAQINQAKNDMQDLDQQVEAADAQLAALAAELSSECSETETIVNVPTTQGGFTPVTVPTGAQTVTVVTTGGDTETVHVPTQTTQSPVVTEVVTTPNGGSTVVTFTAPPVLTGVPPSTITITGPSEVEEEFHPKPTFVVPSTPTWTSGFITGVPAPETEEENQSAPTFHIPTSSGTETVHIPTGGSTVITTTGGHTETVHNPSTGLPYITEVISTPNGGTTQVTLSTRPTVPTDTTVTIEVPTSNGGYTDITIPSGQTSASFVTTDGSTDTVHVPTGFSTPYVTKVISTPEGTTTLTTSIPQSTPIREVEEEYLPPVVISVPTSYGGSTIVTIPSEQTSATHTTTDGSTITVHVPTDGETPYVTKVITTPSGSTTTLTTSLPQHTPFRTPSGSIATEREEEAPVTTDVLIPTSQGGETAITFTNGETSKTIETTHKGTETVHVTPSGSVVITEVETTTNGGTTTVITDVPEPTWVHTTSLPPHGYTLVIPTTSNQPHSVYIPYGAQTVTTTTSYGRTETVHIPTDHTEVTVITEVVSTPNGYTETIKTIPFPEPTRPSGHVTIPTTNGGQTEVTIPSDRTTAHFTTASGRTETLHVPTDSTPYVTEQAYTPSGSTVTLTLHPTVTGVTWTTGTELEEEQSIVVPTPNGHTTVVTVPTGETSVQTQTTGGNTITIHDPPTGTPYITEVITTPSGGTTEVTLVTVPTPTWTPTPTHHEAEEEHQNVPTFVIPTSSGYQTVSVPTGETVTIVTSGGSTETVHNPTTGTPYITEVVTTPNGGTTQVTLITTPTVVTVPSTETVTVPTSSGFITGVTGPTPSEVEEEFVPKPTFVVPTGTTVTESVVVVPTPHGGSTTVPAPTGSTSTVTVVTSGGHTETVHVPSTPTATPYITEVVTTPNGGTTEVTLITTPAVVTVTAPTTEFEEENWQTNGTPAYWTIGTPTYFTEPTPLTGRPPVWTESTGPLPPTTTFQHPTPVDTEDTEVHAYNSSGDQFTVIINKEETSNGEDEVVVVMKCTEVYEQISNSDN